MINVTEQARKELKRFLYSKVDMPQARLRIIDRGQGKLGLDIDIELQGDELLKHDGSTVLVIDSELATIIKNITLDVDDTPKGSEFVLCYE